MQKASRLWMLFALVAIGLSHSACMEVGAFSKQQQSAVDDSLVLKVTRSDILDVVAEVGRSMEFDVVQISKQAIMLQRKSSMGSLILIGKTNHATLTVSASDEGKKLNIQLSMMGNLGSGGQEEAQKIIEEFKSRLKKRIGL